MKTFRVGVFALTSAAVSFAYSALAVADIRSIDPVQTLTRPATQAYTSWGTDVAVDGGYIIVLGGYEGGQQALLYRRNNSNGQWVFRRALVTWTGPSLRSSVVMRNGIAAVQFDDQISLFELSGGDYVRQTSAAPIRHHGGTAISGRSVIIGGNNCDYDAVIYQKGSNGSWAISGRIDDNQGECLAPWYNYAVELHYDYALLRLPYGNEGFAWRRNGTALDWVPAGTLPFLPDEGATVDSGYALQGATAVAPSGVVWRRSGASTWTRQSALTSVDSENSSGRTFDVVFRDGVLIASQSGRYLSAQGVYIEASPGQFEHVGTLRTYRPAVRFDVSGRTVVASQRDFSSQPNYDVQVLTLPTQLRAPAPLVNDFEDRDVSDFTFSGGQFGLATRGADDVLVQSASTGLAIGVMSDSDWIDMQRVEVDVTPTYGTGGWVGLVARYVDAENYYYVRIRDDRTFGIYKRVNGVDTLLHDDYFYNQPPATFRATFDVTANRITATFSFQTGVTIFDNSLTHGRGGVATFMARADFDDVHVGGTETYSLFERAWGFSGSDYEFGMDVLSGDWAVLDDGDPENSSLTGLWQRDTSGNAVAVIGVPVQNQEVNARMKLTSYAASQQGAWFGLLARYVDARNHYYVTVRSTGQIQIRKIVNGVITVLATSNFTAVPNRYYEVQFLVINDQLHLYVDQTLVANAHDRDLTSGRYGIATYRTAANWDAFWVLQP
jgi:hypothetical protein